MTSASSALAKVIGVATALLTIPMTMQYLGAERFGLWMTVSSLTGLLAFADFGLGNGLLNAVASAHGRDERHTIKGLIASALAALASIGMALALVLGAIVLLFDLSSAFGLKDAVALADLQPTLLAFLGCFVLSLLAGVTQRTLSGLQEGFLNGLLAAVSTGLCLLGLLVVIHLQAGLPWLVFALLGIPALTSIIGGCLLLRRRHPDLLPSWRDVDLTVALSLTKAGTLFFVLQLATSLAYSSDNLVGSASAGAAAVGDFAIVAKLFGIVSMLVGMVVGPWWPAYAEALARGDVAWVRQTLLRSIPAVVAVSALASLLLCAIFPIVTRLWLAAALPASSTLLAGFAAWTVVSAVGTAISMFLNGANVVRPQMIIALVFAVLCFVCKVWLTPRFGLDALPWINCALYAMLVLVPYAVILPRLLRRDNNAPVLARIST